MRSIILALALAFPLTGLSEELAAPEGESSPVQQPLASKTKLLSDRFHLFFSFDTNTQIVETTSSSGFNATSHKVEYDIDMNNLPDIGMEYLKKIKNGRLGVGFIYGFKRTTDFQEIVSSSSTTTSSNFPSFEPLTLFVNWYISAINEIEFLLGINYTKIDVTNSNTSSNLEIESDQGFQFGLALNLNEHLRTQFIYKLNRFETKQTISGDSTVGEIRLNTLLINLGYMF